MSPNAVAGESPARNGSKDKTVTLGANRREPMRVSGLLDKHAHFESTPPIGREYPDVQLAGLMNSPDRDQYIRDLAITVSERGVVFFRNQTGLTVEMQKDLVNLLGILTGRRKENGLHIHPLIEGKQEVGVNKANDIDKQISVISSQLSRKLEGEERYRDIYQFASGGWHSDMTFEHIPSDYAVLKMRELPPSGGDTLWASAYEVYDRLSKPMQKFLEGLTATHDNPAFINQAKRLNFEIHPGPRGAPEKVGTDLVASHPVIRTNPVTGWKSVYAAHGQVQKINELPSPESDLILGYLNKMTYANHDLQVRFKWGVNDVAIWDNRSTYHTATKDLEEGAIRTGNRSVSMGERPYLDPFSCSRREGLAARAASKDP
ncbi:hypothetical protein VTN77DRAFT_4607 [Rasamsonia byssochlamydoides]|uniref:uncharacterized protein n=1 Tax=Rasamsonia byssochlamydoides TaxID=89139 RepID=UPI003742EC4E